IDARAHRIVNGAAERSVGIPRPRPAARCCLCWSACREDVREFVELPTIIADEGRAAGEIDERSGVRVVGVPAKRHRGHAGYRAAVIRRGGFRCGGDRGGEGPGSRLPLYKDKARYAAGAALDKGHLEAVLREDHRVKDGPRRIVGPIYGRNAAVAARVEVVIGDDVRLLPGRPGQTRVEDGEIAATRPAGGEDGRELTQACGPVAAQVLAPVFLDAVALLLLLLRLRRVCRFDRRRYDGPDQPGGQPVVATPSGLSFFEAHLDGPSAFFVRLDPSVSLLGSGLERHRLRRGCVLRCAMLEGGARSVCSSEGV